MLKRRSRSKSALSVEGSFLDLCKLSVRRVEDLVSGGNLLNQRQCQDLSFKLSRIILNIGELLSQTGVPTSDPRFRPVLKSLYRFLKKAKSLVKNCGEEEWWVAAVSQIQNENAFREILLDVGLCYNVVCEQASSINKEWNLHREDLRVSRTVFLPASDGEVLLDLQNLQERLEHLANGTGSIGLFSQFLPTRKPPARNRCLARYLLVKSRYTSEQSQANTLETGSAIFLQRDHEPPGTWGIQSRFIGGGAGASGVCSTTWMSIRCAKKEFRLQDAERFFLQEAGILAHLKHPSIVNFFCCGYGQRKGDRFIAMELMEKSLSDLIEEQNGKYFAIPIVVDMILQIARGMWYLHDQGVAHRDLKPQNVVVNSLTSPHLMGFFSVKLVDFGMSKTKVEITKPNTISVRGVGTTRYRAPEIYPCDNLDGISRALWFKADAFSFAMTCAHLLCLQIPFGDQVKVTELNNELMRGVRPELPRDCPEELEVLLKSCWDTDPLSRPSFMDICIRLETFRLQLLRGFSTPCQGFQEQGREFIKMVLEKHSCIQRPSFVKVNDCQGEMNDPFDMSHSLLGLRQVELETIPSLETIPNMTVTEVPILSCTLGHALEHLPKSGEESSRICDMCRGYITEEVYHCQTCKFYAHPDCVEIKDTVEVSFHDHSLHPLIQNYYRDNSDAVCGFCMEPVQGSEWVYRCQLCDFDVHALCTKYPKTLTRGCVHKHNLTLEQSSLEKSLLCSCCSVDIKGYHYTCNREHCDIDLHPSCAILIFNPLCVFDTSLGEPNTTLDSGLLGVPLEKLAKEFKRIVVQHTLLLTLPDRLDPTETKDITEQINLPLAVLKRLQAIMQILANNGGFEKCVESYREIRSTRAIVSLQGLKLDYLKTCSPEAVEKIDWDVLQTMIVKWSEHIEVAVKVLYASEKRLCEQVLGKVSKGAYIDECLYKVARIGIGQFISFGEGFARSHRGPEKLFKLLDMHDSLDKCMPTVNTLFDGEFCLELRSQLRELQKMVVAQACRTFWEFKHWVVEQHEGSMAPDGSVTKLSSYVVNYLKYLVSDEYNPIMDKVLKIEQSWRGQRRRGEESGLANGVLLVMQALERQVEGRSNEYSDPALRHVFLMNNLWYMRTRSKNCRLGPFLGEQWLTEQLRKVENHALAYKHEVWGGVLKYLSREGFNSQGGRSAVRELVLKRIRDFTAAFKSACQRHQRWSIAEEDLREGTKDAVLQAVVPTYKSFVSSFDSLFDSGSVPKNYYKYTPENIEHIITELYNGRLKN